MDSSACVSVRETASSPHALVGVVLQPVHPGRRQVHRGTPVKLCALSYCQWERDREIRTHMSLGVRIQFQPADVFPVKNMSGHVSLCDGNTVGSAFWLK